MGAARTRTIAVALIALGTATAAVCALMFPAVEGLGAKVRLPVFHGAMTWVNLTLFTLMALVALAFLITRGTHLYPLEEGLRWMGVPMWLVGSALGLTAALNTWDFTGSKSSPLSVAAEDPRLMAQFLIMLAAVALIALSFVFEDRRVLAAGDIVFTGGMWFLLMRAVLGPGRALHPDSPVLNSEEIVIKLWFFGIVAGISLASFAGAWWLSRMRAAVARLNVPE